MFSNTRAAAKIRGVGERASGSDFYSVFHAPVSWENLLARGSRHFFSYCASQLRYIVYHI